MDQLLQSYNGCAGMQVPAPSEAVHTLPSSAPHYCLSVYLFVLLSLLTGYSLLLPALLSLHGWHQQGRNVGVG